MTEPITNKKRMYHLLASGAFGNTVRQWFDVDSWLEDPETVRWPLWGVRSGLAGGDRRMRLNVPYDEVESLYRSWFPGGGGNLSPMIDRWATLRAEVWESHVGPCGLTVFYPTDVVPEDPWRGSFRKYGRQVSGVSAVGLLRHHLWPSDYEDLRTLLEQYPRHVVELSACSRAVGVIPHRNTVVWECRLY